MTCKWNEPNTPRQGTHAGAASHGFGPLREARAHRRTAQQHRAHTTHTRNLYWYRMHSKHMCAHNTSCISYVLGICSSKKHLWVALNKIPSSVCPIRTRGLYSHLPIAHLLCSSHHFALGVSLRTKKRSQPRMSPSPLPSAHCPRFPPNSPLPLSSVLYQVCKTN